MLKVGSDRQSPAPRRHVLRSLCALAAIPVVLFAAGCTDSGSGGGGVMTPPTATSGDPLAPQPLAERQKVSFGISSRLESFASVLLADKLGEFEKENLEVEFKFAPANESALLVAQGQLDVAFGSYSAGMYNLIGQGSPLKFVFPGPGQPATSTQGFWMNDKVVSPTDAPLSASDFVGQKILTSTGDGAQGAYRMYDWVRDLPGGSDVSATDLNFETFDPASVGQALSTGAAGVGLVNSPHDLPLRDDSCCSFLKGAMPADSVSGLFFGPSMDGRADVGAAIVRSLARTVTTHLQAPYRENESTMSALAEALDLDRATLSSIPELYWDPEFSLNAQSNLDAQSFFRDRGLLKYESDLTLDQVFDTRYLEAIGVTQG